MNKSLVISVLILVVSACGPTPTVAPSTPDTPLNRPSPVPATETPQELAPTSTVPNTPTIVSESVTAAGLWLQVLSPQDEAVINSPEVDVIGLAPAGAVVSINDEISIVGDDQQFKTTVFLDEGPNLIEILVSDEAGNETSLLLTVIYEP